MTLTGVSLEIVSNDVVADVLLDSWVRVPLPAPYNGVYTIFLIITGAKFQLSDKWLQTSNKNRTIISISEKRIDTITKSLSRAYLKDILLKLVQRNPENAKDICNYIIAEKTEINIKISTIESRIKVLVWLSNFFEDKLLFREMTKDDILGYLNNLKKSITEDDSQKWIWSYNVRQVILNKFFRWLYNPEEPDYTKRITPSVMKGIKQLPRKEKTLYKNSDLWTNEEHAVFFKYCPSKRDKAFHYWETIPLPDLTNS